MVAAGASYGRSETGAGEKVNVEFVSANPTGPVTLASARWAAVGDTISRLLEATGYEVAREYYFNDHGAQIDRFANCLLARGRGHEVPEDGYQGSYVAEIAQAVLAEHPEVAEQDDDEARESLRAYGVPLMFEEIKRTLERVPGRLRRLVPRERPARERRGPEGHRPAHRARQRLREGRRAVAGHREVR